MIEDADRPQTDPEVRSGEDEDRDDGPATVIVPADPIFFTSSACGSGAVRPRPLTSVFRTLGSPDAKLPGR